ncbi:MAG: AI-2E family transporter [Planctomycetia bacterium]|nr:AI-2E family transporter [Planctomycetia bacterium]
MPETVATNGHWWPPRRVIAGTLVVCGVCAAFALGYLARHVLFLLFIAIVLSTALAPLVGWAVRRGLPRNIAVPLVYVLLLAVLITPAAVGLPMIVDQAQEVLRSLPESYEDIRDRIGHLSPAIAARLPEHPPWIEEEDQVVEEALHTARQAITYSGVVVRGGFAVAVILLMSFFWTIHEDHTIRSLLLFLPRDRRPEAGELVGDMQAKVGAYVRGEGLLCLVVGVMSLVAYWIIGLPHALVLAVTAGVLEAIPVFGPALGAIAPMLVALSVDPSKIVWVLVAAIVIQQSENYLLVPRIMGASVGVHPIVTLLAIAGFGALAGVPGAVLAIPMAAIIQLILERFVLRPGLLDPERPAGRDTVSRLRFEAQELVQQVRLQVRHKEDPTSGRNDRIEEAIEAIASEIDAALERHDTAATAATVSPGEGAA